MSNIKRVHEIKDNFITALAAFIIVFIVLALLIVAFHANGV
jgi:hypothetical protein